VSDGSGKANPSSWCHFELEDHNPAEKPWNSFRMQMRLDSPPLKLELIEVHTSRSFFDHLLISYLFLWVMSCPKFIFLAARDLHSLLRHQQEARTAAERFLLVLVL